MNLENHLQNYWLKTKKKLEKSKTCGIYRKWACKMIKFLMIYPPMSQKSLKAERKNKKEKVLPLISDNLITNYLWQQNNTTKQ
jgi:hypothetical protein